jgi:hypothetical protein
MPHLKLIYVIIIVITIIIITIIIMYSVVVLAIKFWTENGYMELLAFYINVSVALHIVSKHEHQNCH